MRKVVAGNRVFALGGRVTPCAPLGRANERRAEDCAPYLAPRARVPLDVTATMAVSPAVAHAPDGAVAVFADEEAAVFGDGDSNRATPHLAFGRHETRHKIFIFAERFAR